MRERTTPRRATRNDNAADPTGIIFLLLLDQTEGRTTHLIYRSVIEQSNSGSNRPDG